MAATDAGATCDMFCKKGAPVELPNLILYAKLPTLTKFVDTYSNLFVSGFDS